MSEVTEKIVHVLREGYDFENTKAKFESRVGISLFPVDTSNADMLMRGAELALTYAKQANKFVAYYQPRKMFPQGGLAQPDFPVVGDVLSSRSVSTTSSSIAPTSF